MYEGPRFAVEVISAILYFILVKYMIKPYTLTKEVRYLGLPLGFAFLGVSEVILASQIIQPITGLNGFSVATRTFAFVFVAITYFFSKEPTSNSQLIWSTTLSLLIVGLAVLSLVLIAPAMFNLEVPTSFSIFLRGLSLFFLAYISVHTLREHIKKPAPTTFWIPLGFILLAISQYSQLIRMVDSGYAYGFAFVGGLVTRFVGLAVFLYVAYRAFHRLNKRRTQNEADCA